MIHLQHVLMDQTVLLAVLALVVTIAPVQMHQQLSAQWEIIAHLEAQHSQHVMMVLLVLLERLAQLDIIAQQQE